ncbi:PREDICTED: uncharacterized protein LOC108568847 [Nicrophorus vespilloides]|uniref:Uncharacterized protein LOC108568847 n=1 Tax=Nicrophorus vespilloides TaxID=110193 RepID=A0ABM1NFS3_NICVS|nr:PREDICTED: uncharacterized protein LOC108568847 [Nicrophorus vespilloides]
MEGNDNAKSLQKQFEQNSGVLQQLRMKFERKIDWDVILSVAFETGFELRKATTCLNDITNSTAMSEVKAGLTGNENLDRIVGTLKRGIKVLIMLRGLPGSGKSYLANKIVQESIGNNCTLSDHILSADDYFYSNGNYKYDGKYITEAHRWNQTRAHRLMHDGVSPIIIDNTHTQMWEMKPYCIWGVQYGYMIEIMEPDTPWAFNERELTKRNKHAVPRSKIRDMLDRYEKNLTVHRIFNEFELRYGDGKLPPQPRKYPPILKEEIYISDDEDVDIVNKENNFRMENEQAWQSIDVNSKAYANVETNFDYKDIDDPSLKVIIARNNFNNVAILPPMYKKSGFLDKGTMTDDEENGIDELSLDHLVGLFDNKYPLEYIVEIYEKCNKSVEWAIEILLENNKDILENYKPPPKPKSMEIDESEDVDYEFIEVDDGSSDEDRKRLQIERQNLKQIIEANVDFNDEHYSEHVLQLKHKGKKKNVVSPKASTSREENKESDDSDVIIVDSDPDFDDSEEFIEFNLGEVFVAQLEQKFGDPNIKYPQGFLPIIEMPKSLGKQLHAMYVESIFKQMDAQNAILTNMIREDEELARQLQQEEGRITPNFKTIMSEQKVLSKQQSLNEEWKKQTPDDIAYKMSKHKLLESFPDIPSHDLIEILHAHGNSYTQTVEVLRQSGAMKVNNLNVSEPPISEETMIEMREAQKSNEFKEQAEVKRTADELREEAAEYHRRRKELLQKAQLYQQRKMTEVAMYYSNLASQQTQKFERANNEAANVILHEHFNRLGAFDTLDLHYLRVPEALAALDMFLDRSIRLLKKEKKSDYGTLMILTGRGRNSPGGIPRIKPAVEDRLKARGLKYRLDNPGLIRTKILRTSLMTDSLYDNN